MKIRVTLVIDMDEDAVGEWCEDSGVERSEVRADIRSYVLTTIQGTAQLDGRADVSLVP
jgi:hypothetical protein